MSQIELHIGGYGPRESAHGQGLAAFGRFVESATANQVSVAINYNIMDEGRPNTDLFRLVEAGEMFMCYFSCSYLGSRVPDLNVLDVPFLFADLKQAHEALDGGLGGALRESVASSTGFEVLGFWDNGFRHLTNRLRPIRTPDDCRGLTVRLQPNAFHVALFESWGAVPVAAELQDGIGLIVDGKVDAQENPLANTVAYGVDRVHPHVTMTGHLYGARGLFAHRPTWESFSPEIRRVVAEGARSAVSVQRIAAAGYEESLRRRMEAEGAHFVDLGEEERASFLEASQGAMAMARSAVSDEILMLVAS
ncbi:MAG: TRAP transporter substrate-binding protein [Acidimicrobiia bacterium]